MRGLWFGKEEPNRSLFFQPLMKEAKRLAKDGIKCNISAKSNFIKFTPLCYIAHSVARQLLLNSVQFNGYFGCNWCLHPGKLVDRQIRYTIDDDNFDSRSPESILDDMLHAFIEKKTNMWYKGSITTVKLAII